MPYRVSITREAKGQLLGLSVREQRIIEDGIIARLLDQPTIASKAVKALRINPLAGYELRLGDLRVFYKVEEEDSEILIVIVGRKVGNTLVVEGREFHGHQDNTSERPPG